MAMVKVPKGQHFIKRGDKMKNLYMIVQGEVRQISNRNEMVMGSGGIIGIMECITVQYQNDYVAKEECILFPIPYSKTQDLEKVFRSQPKYATAFLSASIKETDQVLKRYQQLKNLSKNCYAFAIEKYREYKFACSKYSLPEKAFHRMEYVEPFVLEHSIEDWQVQYFTELAKCKTKELEDFYQDNYVMAIGQIMLAGQTMATAVTQMDQICDYLQYNAEVYLNPKKNDLFQLFFDLAARVSLISRDISEIKDKLQQIMDFIRKSAMFDEKFLVKRFTEYLKYDFSTIKEEAASLHNFEDESIPTAEPEPSDAEEVLIQDAQGLLDEEYQNAEEEEDGEDCLAHILEYASASAEEERLVRSKIAAYRKIPEGLDTDEKTRKLRKELTQIFYTTYKAVFKKTMDEQEISPILKMFLNFGFMDVAMVGEENANALYDLTDRLFMCNDKHVYTMYEWLKSIYEGRNEPCRNEFDLDYNGYLAEQQRMGKFDDRKVELLKTDCWEKTQFEMDNMFISTNRATYGRILTFCPILSKKDMIQAAEQMLVTGKRIEEAMDFVRNIDYSIFYREVVFSDPKYGVNKELLQKEILPDVILMPNVGVKAMMWQETAGVKRDTAARMIFPIMTIGNITDMMVETCGRYRWEICRKLQGMRWNDISDKSLTSEYSDYLQYYRKNHDLSTEGKEKLKNALVKAKNNYREVFVLDYVNWIKYESRGSSRLNKVARDMLFRYCPFAKSYRESIDRNPMYQDMISKYKIFNARKEKHARGFTDKYVKSGGEMTIELQENLDYYNL